MIKYFQLETIQGSVTGEQHATSAAITISPGQTGKAGSDWWRLTILSSHWSPGPEETVVMRDLSVVSPPIPDLVTRGVTGPGETSLLGVIRSHSCFVQ